MGFNLFYDFFNLGQYFPYGDYPLAPQFHSYRGDCDTPGYCVDFTGFEGNIFAYEKCSPLNTVINKLAYNLSNARIWVVDEDDKDVPGYEWVKELFIQPNPVQSGRELLFQIDAYVKIFGEGFIIKLSSPISGIPFTLWVIDPRFMFEKSTGKWLLQTDINDINLGWIYRNPYTKTEIEFSNEDVLHIRDVNLNLDASECSRFRGKSRIPVLEKDILNVLAAKDATLSLNKDRGALGLLSPEGKDAAGAVLYTPKDKSELLSEFNRMYGITSGKFKMAISNKPLRYQTIGFNASDLKLYEGIKENVQRICEEFFFPYQLLAETKYSNQKEVWEQLYQDAIIPTSLIYEQLLTRFLGIKGGARINFDFSHVSVLQESEAEKNKAIKERVETVMLLYSVGAASLEELRQAAQLSEDFTPENNNSNE